LPESWVYKYAKKESERFCNACNKIIVPTNEMKKMLKNYKINKEIITIPSGINIYSPSNDEVATFKNKYMNNEYLNCLFIGRDGKEKNIDFLIDAFQIIKQNKTNVHLTIIGDGPERKNIEQKIKKLGLKDSVTLTGYLNKKEVFSAYKAADIMLFPSKTETQGLTAVESIMCGTPVIGINEMGIKNVIEHEISGLLTKDDLTEYVAATLDVLNNSEKRARLSTNAKEVGNKFSHTETGKKLEDILIEVTQNN
ncbi:MAG: glycosyltransferase, partial [Candidatus Margulisiibacteriota bacterium]